MTPLTENFETRLLHELQRLVTEQPVHALDQAPPPHRGRRRFVPAAAAAAAVGAAGVVFVVSDAGNPSSAYAVDRAPNGTVTVEIRSLRDAAGLERKLGEAGVRAKVDYLPAGMMCREPRFARPRSRGRLSVGQRVRRDGTATFTLGPRELPPNATLVITSTGGAGAGRRAVGSLGVAVAQGAVAPCQPVKDTRPAPPPAPSGKGGSGPRLDQSYGPEHGLHTRP